ncbi:MAG: S8 family serine peptidase [Bdellovibrionales bacterium]
MVQKTSHGSRSSTQRAWIILTVLMTLLLAWILMSGNTAQTSSAKISPQLQGFEKRSTTDIIVVMKEQADLSNASDLETKEEKGVYVYKKLSKIALKTQKDLLKTLKGKFEYRSFHIANMISIPAATPELIRELSERSDVGQIIGNPTIPVLGPPAAIAPEMPNLVEDNIVFINADKVWNEFQTNGQGIIVAGQDTGIEWQHPALMNHYRGYSANVTDHNYNWHDAIHQGSSTGNRCGYDSKVPCDDHAHGTHTIGTVVGDDGMGKQIGVAPGSKWIGCRNMDAGNGKPTTYIECFEWFLAPYAFGKNPKTEGDPTKAPHVINNSWGCPITEGCMGSEMLPVLRAMKMAGIMVVVSAGNEGPNCSTVKDQPATHSALTFSVGAHDHRMGTIASFSSRGPSMFDGMLGPDVVAPGVNIMSAVPGKIYQKAGWSGTSMAGPHVVGVVALLWSAVPEFIGKIDMTIDMIEKTATPLKSTQTCGGVPGTMIPNNTYGYGVINILAAVKKAKGL